MNGDLESDPGPSQTLMKTKQNSKREATKSKKQMCDNVNGNKKGELKEVENKRKKGKA